MGKILGARELLADARRAGIPRALVTSSPRTIAEAIVSELPTGTFDVIISDDDVFRTKPHPEPYATAAKALGADPARCVAFEDSATGSQSALSAGCFVVVVSDQPELGAPQLDGSGFTGDDRLTVLRSLEGTSVRDLID